MWKQRMRRVHRLHLGPPARTALACAVAWAAFAASAEVRAQDESETPPADTASSSDTEVAQASDGAATPSVAAADQQEPAATTTLESLPGIVTSTVAPQAASSDVSAPDVAAERAPPEDDDIETITVLGARSLIQTSIEQKRLSTSVVEALSADDIGDIPALSIGEALETLTSAASHREQGGATEISIRGMGPYLGSTVVNGREATNGSGDRSVNFSQFPSELFNKLKVYKTQEARLIEGGVSGQISLETLRPLDYGKRRLQAEGKLAYHPDNANIDDNVRDFGTRFTLSYVDQYELEYLGKLGVSIGYQKRQTTNPEQEFRTTSGWRDCRNDPNVDGGIFRSTPGNCDEDAGNLDLDIDPGTGTAPDGDAPFVFVPSSRSFRQNITDDDREALFAAVQWRPTDVFEINFDIQYSDRTFTEERNDLVFAEQRRVVPGITNVSLQAEPTGEVSLFQTIGRVETNSQFQERLEEYLGGGINLSYQATSRLRLTADVSMSDTSRRENIYQTRLRTGSTDINGEVTNDRIFTSIAIPGESSLVPLVTVRNFDVTNHDLFSSSARTRIDLNQKRDNNIFAVRADAEYAVDWWWLTELVAGVRYSQLKFESVPRDRDTFEGNAFADGAVAAANRACRTDFPESGFLSGPSGGQDLITNVDNDGNVISQGTGSGYATFGARCLIRELLGFLPEVPGGEQTVSNVDVEENTIAAYLQANYAGELGDFPIRGNIGVRMVHTDVNSVGLRTSFTTERNEETGVLTPIENDDEFTSVSGGSNYLEFLPSLNVVVDLAPDVLLRGGVFRGLSRPDPADLGFGRQLSIDDDGMPMTVADFASNAIATGNPNLEPLTSWNFDVALEWYPNPDTILAGGVYYKRFIGGFENVQVTETFEVDGEPLDTPVTTTQTSDEEKNLLGFEVTAAHAFTYLPGILKGFGAKLSLNVAYSDFEFEDANFGSSIVIREDGATERVGIVEPANIFGLSNVVFSGQLYYQLGGFDFQLIVKHRSRYFQQFISTPGNIRYIAANTVLEGRATYRITKNISVRIEGINLLDEPRIQYNPTPNNLAEVNSYGPRLFAGIRGKF